MQSWTAGLEKLWIKYNLPPMARVFLGKGREGHDLLEGTLRRYAATRDCEGHAPLAVGGGLVAASASV